MQRTEIFRNIATDKARRYQRQSPQNVRVHDTYMYENVVKRHKPTRSFAANDSELIFSRNHAHDQIAELDEQSSLQRFSEKSPIISKVGQYWTRKSPAFTLSVMKKNRQLRNRVRFEEDLCPFFSNKMAL